MLSTNHNFSSGIAFVVYPVDKKKKKIDKQTTSVIESVLLNIWKMKHDLDGKNDKKKPDQIRN